MDLEKEVEIDKDWLTVSNYQFKILVMIVALANEKLAFRGKLKDMCEFLGVSNQTSNTTKIKDAIQKLEDKGDVLVLREGQTWTITLSVKAERKPKVIRIRNAWIKAIQQYQAPDKEKYVSWENILKVFVYLCADKRDIKTYDEIRNDLGLSFDVVRRAVWALDEIDLQDLSFKRKLAWFINNDNEWKVKGQRIDIGLDFSRT